MNKTKKIITTLMAIILSSLCFSFTTSASDGFTSSELKDLRFISRSILKSRVQDKKQIDESLEGLRLSLNVIQSEMQSLKSQLYKDSLTVSLDSNTVTATAHFDAQSGAISSPVSAVTTQSSNAEIKNKVNEILSNVTSKRVALEGSLPKFWQVWKDEDKNSKQNKLLIEKLSHLENELTIMESTGTFDLQKIRQLSKSIKLKKREPSNNKIAPTLQSRTQHRN